MNTAVLRQGLSAYTHRLSSSFRANSAGLMLSVTLAATATAISSWLGGPAMVYALMLGFVARYAVRLQGLEAGANYSAKTLLRLGVGLLGAGITFQQVVALGPQVVALAADAIDPLAADVMLQIALHRLATPYQNSNCLADSSHRFLRSAAGRNVEPVGEQSVERARRFEG